MAVSVHGTRLRFTESNDSLVLNCPIKRLRSAGGATGNIFIDGFGFGMSSNASDITFVSLNGYPGGVLSVGTITSDINIIITEIGDVLNPNYFEEDIRNWNGQGTTAVAASETEAAPTVAKATRSKKAEVSE